MREKYTLRVTYPVSLTEVPDRSPFSTTTGNERLIYSTTAGEVYPFDYSSDEYYEYSDYHSGDDDDDYDDDDDDYFSEEDVDFIESIKEDL